MNKKDIETCLAKSLGKSKEEIGNFLDAFVMLITHSVTMGEDIRINNLGVFKSRVRKACKGRNPQTGETIDISAAVQPVFKASQNWKDLLASKAKIDQSGDVMLVKKGEEINDKIIGIIKDSVKVKETAK